jgi:hypothetical protein
VGGVDVDEFIIVIDGSKNNSMVLVFGMHFNN